MQGLVTFILIALSVLIGSNVIAYLLGIQTSEDYSVEDDEPHPF